MRTAVLLGHSYVRRLGELITNRPDLRRGSRNLQWKFLGVGGAKVGPHAPRNRDIFQWVRRASQYHPDIVYLHVGENDLHTTDNNLLVERIIELVHQVVAVCNPQTVILSQLTAFPANADVSGYSYRANRKLKEYFDAHHNQIRNTYIKFWKHTFGIFGPNRLRWYSDDDVHLNHAGLIEYAESVGTILGRAYNHLQ